MTYYHQKFGEGYNTTEMVVTISTIKETFLITEILTLTDHREGPQLLQGGEHFHTNRSPDSSSNKCLMAS